MKYVLFVCPDNAGRSQMAQALFERHAPREIRAESAGQEPAEAVWPEVVEAMGEIGIDLSGRRPKQLTVEMQLHADWAITLACGAQRPYVPTTVEDWDIPGPAVIGHTHKPSIREHGGVLSVNCGSVGKPKDGDPRAAFVVLTPTGQGIQATIGRADYDAEAVARQVAAAGLPEEYPDKLVAAA